MPTLGPLDRRTLKTRCVACTRRKIKCEGKPPCVYCSKRNHKCVPQRASPKNATVFINSCATTSAVGDGAVSVMVRRTPASHTSSLKLFSGIPSESSSVFAGHFFSAFLETNDFGRSLDIETIIFQFQSSPSLHQALIAVGALDLSNKLSKASAVERRDTKVGALNAYRVSIASFQKDISSQDMKWTDSSLWTTFFLGLFELMYDGTGEGFVKHFLFGTSRILQIRGPGAHLSGAGLSFFLTVRVFEICRSLIYSNYSDPTFLCEPSWRELTRQISNESEFWHPKEMLFDLMISCSSLSHRVWKSLESELNYPPVLNSLLQELAAEGLHLRNSLENWYTSFQKWMMDACILSEDTQSVLAKLYFHGISIFLSGIFDYRSEFNHILAPRLSQIQIQYHVDSIIVDTRTALSTTNLGGVLFFFPLRVAGARVVSVKEAGAIVAMLEEISKRSFVVAEAFVLDLKDLWLQKGI